MKKRKTLEELIRIIYKYNMARGWTPAPVDLTKSVVIEAAELFKHFQGD